MAYSNLRHETERKGRSVILEREIINLQSKNPCGTPLYGKMRGSIRNLKAVDSVTNVNSLTQLYAILRINSIICYQSSR